MLLKCRIHDSLYGAADAVVNTDNVLYMLPHPDDPEKTLVRFNMEGEVLCILAGIADIRLQIEEREDIANA